MVLERIEGPSYRYIPCVSVTWDKTKSAIVVKVKFRG